MILPLLLLFLLLKKKIFSPLQRIFSPSSLYQAKVTGTLAAWSFVTLLGCDGATEMLVKQLVIVAMWPSMGHFGTLVVGRAVGLSWHQHGERRSGVHTLQLFRSEFGVCSTD